MSIAQYLADQHIRFETLYYPPAFTAQRRAAHLRIPGEYVIKSVLLRGPGGYLVAILPATARVNTEALSAALGGPVQIANADDVARVFADCEWGVTAPFGSRYGLPTYLDAGLPPNTELVLPADSHHEAVRVRCGDFERAEQPRRLPLACRCRP
jgi:Ala-tRNA(Pro) deacylase